MLDITKVKQLKEKTERDEARLLKLMNKAEGIWEETGLDPKDPSYLVEKTMRFELAQKDVTAIFSSFKELVESYKNLCQELEKTEE